LDDGEAEVIVGSHAFDFIDLIDEEVVLSLPMVPKHDVCPTVHASVVSGADGSLGVADMAELEARLASADDEVLPGELPLSASPDAEAVVDATADKPSADASVTRDGRPNPFAALAGLRQTLSAQREPDAGDSAAEGAKVAKGAKGTANAKAAVRDAKDKLN